MKKAARFNEVTAARTDWFPGSVKPAMRGEYETRFDIFGVITYGRSHWNGRRWSRQGGAMEFVPHAWQAKEWRGLAADPRAAA